MEWRKKRRIQRRMGEVIRKAEQRINRKVIERMKELDKDPAFNEQIEKELASVNDKEGAEEYIKQAPTIAERESRQERIRES